MNSKPITPRTLKVELAGDVYKGKTYPKIRIQGKWLARIGFKPSGRIWIVSPQQGEMIIRFVEP